MTPGPELREPRGLEPTAPDLVAEFKDSQQDAWETPPKLAEGLPVETRLAEGAAGVVVEGPASHPTLR